MLYFFEGAGKIAALTERASFFIAVKGPLRYNAKVNKSVICAAKVGVANAETQRWADAHLFFAECIWPMPITGSQVQAAKKVGGEEFAFIAAD